MLQRALDGEIRAHTIFGEWVCEELGERIYAIAEFKYSTPLVFSVTEKKY